MKNPFGRSRWAEQAKYWKTVPAGATFLVLAGIFCLFASFSLMSSIVNFDLPVGSALAAAGVTASLSTALAYSASRARVKSIIAVLVLMFAWIWLRFKPDTVPSQSRPAQDAEITHRVRIEASLAMLTIISGYAFIASFLRKEGRRVFGPLTEVKLAREVHQALVPAVARRIGQYEIYGDSLPSGQVGGDLVDVISGGTRWTAYLADVSGHGVPAGMIMAMVKSAMRMASTENGAALSIQLAHLNRTLAALCASNVFVTFAGLTGNNGAGLEFALAGHLPILHYRKQLSIVEQRSVSNLPLAVFPGTQFETATIMCEPGDTLAILTDGLTEIADARGQELGLPPLQAAFLQLAATGAPLEKIGNGLCDVSRKHGMQTDDQTVLLVRHAGSEG